HLIRRRQLGTERRGRAPPEPRGRTRSEIAVRLIELALVEQQRILVHDDRIGRLGLPDTMAYPCRVQWALVRNLSSEGLTLFSQFGSFRIDAFLASVNPRLADPSVERACEGLQNSPGRSSDIEVGRKATNRNSREQRVEAALDDLATGR